MCRFYPFILFIIPILCSINIITINSTQADLQKLGFCPITKSSLNDYEPQFFNSSNNLLRKPGQVPTFSGKKIIVYGRVLDQNCLAIQDAKVYIWQVNNLGKYPYQPLRNRINQQLVLPDPLSTFTGNGTTTTSNKGEFIFITLYPRPIDIDYTASVQQHTKALPQSYINIRVESKNLVLQSQLVLATHNKVSNISELIDSPAIIAFIQQEPVDIYHFEIILPTIGMRQHITTPEIDVEL